MHEVVVVERCDFCRTDLSRKPTATRARKVTVDGKAFLVDACPSCTKRELMVLDIIVEHSRPVEAKPKRSGTEVSCPECGKVAKNNAGLGIHLSRAHGIRGAFQ